MRGSIGTRFAAALAVVVGIIALAAPAPAVVPASVTGTITIGSNVYDVGGGGGGGSGDPAPCPGSQTSDVTFGSGTWSASGTFVAPFQVGTSATWYQATISILTASGTYSGSSPFAMAGSLTWQAVLQQIDTTTCAKTALCTVRARTPLVAPSQHTGSLPTPAVGDVTELFGSSNVAGGAAIVAVGGACPVTLSSALVGQHILADLDLTW